MHLAGSDKVVVCFYCSVMCEVVDFSIRGQRGGMVMERRKGKGVDQGMKFRVDEVYGSVVGSFSLSASETKGAKRVEPGRCALAVGTQPLTSIWLENLCLF